MNRLRFAVVAGLLILIGTPVAGDAFSGQGCGSGECRDCHRLTREEAASILGAWVDNVLGVEESPVKGLWLLHVEKGGQRGPVYLDYSKKFIVSGQVFQLETRSNVTGLKEPLSAKTDPAAIPLEDAILIGNARGRKRVIVFSDPECHFCGKLHEAIKEVAAKDPEAAFYIKIFSRTGDPAVVRKALAVVCGKSPKLLEDAYAGKELPPPGCDTDAVEKTALLSRKLTLMGTPAMILPDGRILRGYRDAATILRELGADNAPGGGPGK